MPARATASRPISTLALWLVVLSALLVPATTLAQTHRSACPTRTATHAKARAHRPRCAAHAVKGAHRPAARHAARKHAAKAHTRSMAAAPQLTPALCEDESSPKRTGNGTFTCADGSEPACEDESSPIRSGHALECVVPPVAVEAACDGEESSTNFCLTGSSGAGEPICEDGSTPGQQPGGGETCEDGSEPACEDGSAPMPSHGDQLVCENALAATRTR